MEPVNQLISPAVGCESFEVGGVAYTRIPFDELPLGRARLLQRFQTELQFDMSIPAVQQALVAMEADFNGTRWMDGCVKLARLKDGADVLGQNRFRQAEIVALFYGAPGEDRADSSFKLVQEKVAAWGAVPAPFFTKTAFFLLLGFWQACQPAPEEAEAAPSPPDSPTA